MALKTSSSSSWAFAYVSVVFDTSGGLLVKPSLVGELPFLAGMPWGVEIFGAFFFRGPGVFGAIVVNVTCLLKEEVPWEAAGAALPLHCRHKYELFT
jgi:hypothetical protein